MEITPATMSDRSRFPGRIVLPIAWDRLPGAPSQEAHDALQVANDGVLNFLLRHIESEAALRPTDERLADALAPMHVKLDMIVEMLARLSYRDVELPVAREIDFALDRLAWTSPAPLREQDWLRFRLYFHPTFLEPVLLHGRVSGCAPEAEAGCRAEADLIGMSETNEEALARLAFLAQRRQLAQRSGPSVKGAR
jgi:hypothetical protein